MSASLFDRDWNPDGDLSVGPVSTTEAVRLISRWHYARGGGSRCTCVGLYNDFNLVGVAAFGTPVSPDAAEGVLGPEHQARIMDLQRLALVDAAPTNTESWFIVRALRTFKALRPHTWAVTSFADMAQGHTGVIYQATNAIYGGVGTANKSFIDDLGRLRSSRYDGKGVSDQQAADWGWTRAQSGGKHRYVYLLPDDRRHRRELERLLLWPRLPYPKVQQVAA